MDQLYIDKKITECAFKWLSQTYRVPHIDIRLFRAHIFSFLLVSFSISLIEKCAITLNSLIEKFIYLIFLCNRTIAAFFLLSIGRGSVVNFRNCELRAWLGLSISINKYNCRSQ